MTVSPRGQGKDYDTLTILRHKIRKPFGNRYECICEQYLQERTFEEQIPA